MLRFTAPITPRDLASTVRQGSGRGLRWLPLAVLALFVASAAVAESPARNVLNPPGQYPWAFSDERGLTLLTQHRRRTPTGLLYPYPAEPPRYSALGDEWLYRGLIEFGGFWDGGNEDEARFEQYTDWSDGVFFNSLGFELQNPERGYYLDFRSGGIGRDDEFYRVDLGRAGWLRLRGSFDRVPHRLANDARVLFSGADGDTLTLPAGLSPGNNTEAELDAAIAVTGESSLDTRRDRTQLALDFKLLPELNLFARFRSQDRRGSRFYGGAFSFPPVGATTGGAVETAEPINDRTYNFSGGLQYGGDSFQANLVYNGSRYHNHNSSLTFENPFTIAAAPARNLQFSPACIPDRL